jgi:transposase
MVAADARTAITFALSPGQASDTSEGRKLLGGIGPLPAPLHRIMDRAYEDNETLQLALDFGFIPVVPSRPQRLEPWQYDKAMYRRRNEIERLFRRAERLSAHLLALRQTRLGLPCLPPLRPYRRSPQIPN